MAIDTEGKRRSTLGVWAASRILPVADGVIAIYDRQRMLVYSLESEGPAPSAPGIIRVIDAGIPTTQSSAG